MEFKKIKETAEKIEKMKIHLNEQNIHILEFADSSVLNCLNWPAL